MFDSTSLTIGMLPGDGIGPELMEEALKVIDAVGAGASLVEIPAPSLEPEAAQSELSKRELVLAGPLTSGLEQPWAVSLDFFARIQKTEQLTVIEPFGDGAMCSAVETAKSACVQTVSIQSKAVSQLFDTAFDWAALHGFGKVDLVTGPATAPELERFLQSLFNETATGRKTVSGSVHRLNDVVTALADRKPGFDLVVSPDGSGRTIADVSVALSVRQKLSAIATLGTKTAIFQPGHAPNHELVGTKRINPSAMICALAMLMRHAGRAELANMIDTALSHTIADGVHTDDIAGPDTTRRVSGRVFTQAVIARLGARTNMDLLKGGVTA